jgi:hypothetical protein
MNSRLCHFPLRYEDIITSRTHSNKIKSGLKPVSGLRHCSCISANVDSHESLSKTNKDYIKLRKCASKENVNFHNK